MNSSNSIMVKPVSEVDCDLEIVADHQMNRLLLHYPRPGPADRLTCMIVGKYYALNNFVTLRDREQAAIGVLVASQQPHNERLLEVFKQLLEAKAGAQQMAEALCTQLVSFHHLPAALTHDDVVRAAIARAAVALDLAGPTHVLLAGGGGADIRVDWQKTGLNAYHTSSRPRPEMIVRSSTTACPPGQLGYEQADNLRAALLKAGLNGDPAAVFTKEMEQVRNRIASVLHLDRIDPLPAVITTPSVEDTELVIAQLALERHRELVQHTVSDTTVRPAAINFFIVADEIGADRLAAGAMRSFDSLAPDGTAPASDYLEGAFPDAIEVVTLPEQNGNYQVRSDCQQFESRLEKRLHQTVCERGQVAIVHLIAASAAGLSCMAPEFLVRVKERYGNWLIAVVDATQMRCDERLLAAFIESGCLLMLSGSTFIAGPPFSSALVLSLAEAQTLKKPVAGLGHYISAGDVDSRLASFRRQLPDWKNKGLLLRWHAALANMERYVALERKQRHDIIERWRSYMVDMIAHEPHLKIYQIDDGLRAAGSCFRVDEHDTIVPVSVSPDEFNPGGLRSALDRKGLRQVYEWLFDDISTRLPLGADSMVQLIAARPCLTGRPVTISADKEDLTVLPIALSATDILRCARGESEFANVLEEDRLLITKLGLIARHVAHLQQMA